MHVAQSLWIPRFGWVQRAAMIHPSPCSTHPAARLPTPRQVSRSGSARRAGKETPVPCTTRRPALGPWRRSRQSWRRPALGPRLGAPTDGSPVTFAAENKRSTGPMGPMRAVVRAWPAAECREGTTPTAFSRSLLCLLRYALLPRAHWKLWIPSRTGSLPSRACSR